MKVLIDTCIIIDALQNREPFCADAQAIFLLAANRRLTGFLSAKSVADIYYLTHKVTHSVKKTKQILRALFSLFELVDTTGSDCLQAITSDISDFEDAVMVGSAVRANMDCIVTRNLKDYIASPIPVYGPKDFLAQMEA